MASVRGKIPWWKTLLVILAIVAALTALLYLEVYLPMFKQLEATATPGVTFIP